MTNADEQAGDMRDLNDLANFIRDRISEDEAAGADLSGIRWFIASRDRIALDVATAHRASLPAVLNAVREIGAIWSHHPDYRRKWAP